MKLNNAIVTKFHVDGVHIYQLLLLTDDSYYILANEPSVCAKALNLTIDELNKLPNGWFRVNKFNEKRS